MIEIIRGTVEEQLIHLLHKKYPITIREVQNQLHISKQRLMRVLLKLQMQGVLRLEPLPETTYIRLMRHDFLFVGAIKPQKSQRKHRPTSQQSFDTTMYQ